MNERKQKIEAIFEEALALSAPEQRAGHLDLACGNDADLRREVEDLVRAAEQAGGFLTVKSDEIATAHSAVSEQPGNRIGPYKLLETIGEGGCGVVYLAAQEQPVRRQVALKIIKPGMDSRQVIARFAAERQALALMDHPNIARFFDAGATAFGRPYFVMELARGTRITDYCQQKNLSTRQRLGLFIQVCHAVQHAHQKGTIHRDLKPSNILVTESDGRPVPKVIDFGIAKATEQKLTDQTVHTQFAALIGTPDYMSPEQAELASQDIDTRSDIYSLGVLLYQLLTGTTPFDAKELLQAGLDELRRVIRTVEPPTPSTRLTQARVAPDGGRPVPRSDLKHPKSAIATDLDWIVMKCLEKDRARRYETASSLAADLQRHLSDEPVIARPPSAADRFRKLIRRHRFAVAAGSAIGIALLVGLGASIWMFLRERAALRIADAARHTAQIEATKSQQVAVFLQEMLNGVGPAAARGRDTQMLREILAKTAQRLGQGARIQPEVEVELRNTIGRVHWALGEYRNAEAEHRAALKLAERIWGRDDLTAAATRHDLAVALRKLGQYQDAAALDLEALAVRRRWLGEEHPDLVRSLIGLAGDLDGQNDLPGAERHLVAAISMGRKIHGPEHEDIGRAFNLLALVKRARGDQTNSFALNRAALALRQKLLGNDHPETFQSLHNLALNLMDLGRLPEAEAHFREVLATERRVVGHAHPGLALTLYNLAQVVRKQGDVDQAETLHRDALSMRRAFLTNDHPAVLASLEALAEVRWSRGDWAEAESFLREVLAFRRAQPDKTATANTLFNLASLQQKRGDFAAAETYHSEALALRREALGDEHIEVLDSLNRLGALHLLQGNGPAAARHFRAVLATRHATNAAAQGAVDLARQNLITLLYRQRQLPEIEQLQREALTDARRQHPENPQLLERWLDDLAEVLYRQSKFAEAEPIYQESLSRKRARLSATNEAVISVTASLARLLSDWAWNEQTTALSLGNSVHPNLERASEAERLLHQCLTARHHNGELDSWRIADTQSRLGFALFVLALTDRNSSSSAREVRFQEAESFLLRGHDRLQRSKSAEAKYQRDALDRLARYYHTRPPQTPDADHAARAAHWRRQLEDFDAAHRPSDAAPPAETIN